MIKFTDKIYNWKLKSFLKFPGRLDNCCRHRRNVLVVSSTTTNNDDNDSNNDDKNNINNDDKNNINNDNKDNSDMDDKHNSDKQPAYAPVPQVNIHRVITWTKIYKYKMSCQFCPSPKKHNIFKIFKVNFFRFDAILVWVVVISV